MDMSGIVVVLFVKFLLKLCVGHGYTYKINPTFILRNALFLFILIMKESNMMRLFLKINANLIRTKFILRNAS